MWRYGWFADPLYFGDYPAEMKEIIGNLSAAEGRATSRLPSFTVEEKTILKGRWLWWIQTRLLAGAGKRIFFPRKI